jgi:hypothetical protein
MVPENRINYSATARKTMIIIQLLAIYGFVFLIKETDGPWGIISWFRNKLMTNKFVGVFFYKLLSCYFCSGCWAGGIIYLLSYHNFVLSDLIIWFLAGGSISFMLNLIVEKLSVNEKILNEQEKIKL